MFLHVIIFLQFSEAYRKLKARFTKKIPKRWAERFNQPEKLLFSSNLNQKALLRKPYCRRHDEKGTEKKTIFLLPRQVLKKNLTNPL